MASIETSIRIPSLAEAEAAIGEPAARWVSRCYEIAFKLVAAELVPGRAVYGHYLGPVAAGSYFSTRGANGFVGHGWISLPDGRVLDPTRWVFEGREPYLYVGALGEPDDPIAADWALCICGHLRGEHRYGGFANACRVCTHDCEDYERDRSGEVRFEYDEGGNSLREAMLTPPPAFDPDAESLQLSLEPRLHDFLLGLLGSPAVTIRQAAWIANLPLARLGEDARAIYQALCDAGWAGLLPLDNKLRVLGEDS